MAGVSIRKDRIYYDFSLNTSGGGIESVESDIERFNRHKNPHRRVKKDDLRINQAENDMSLISSVMKAYDFFFLNRFTEGDIATIIGSIITPLSDELKRRMRRLFQFFAAAAYDLLLYGLDSDTAHAIYQLNHLTGLFLDTTTDLHNLLKTHVSAHRMTTLADRAFNDIIDFFIDNKGIVYSFMHDLCFELLQDFERHAYMDDYKRQRLNDRIDDARDMHGRLFRLIFPSPGKNAIDRGFIGTLLRTPNKRDNLSKDSDNLKASINDFMDSIKLSCIYINQHDGRSITFQTLTSRIVGSINRFYDEVRTKQNEAFSFLPQLLVISKENVGRELPKRVVDLLPAKDRKRLMLNKVSYVLSIEIEKSLHKSLNNVPLNKVRFWTSDFPQVQVVSNLNYKDMTKRTNSLVIDYNTSIKSLNGYLKYLEDGKLLNADLPHITITGQRWNTVQQRWDKKFLSSHFTSRRGMQKTTNGNLFFFSAKNLFELFISLKLINYISAIVEKKLYIESARSISKENLYNTLRQIPYIDDSLIRFVKFLFVVSYGLGGDYIALLRKSERAHIKPDLDSVGRLANMDTSVSVEQGLVREEDVQRAYSKLLQHFNKMTRDYEDIIAKQHRMNNAKNLLSQQSAPSNKKRR